MEYNKSIDVQLPIEDFDFSELIPVRHISDDGTVSGKLYPKIITSDNYYLFQNIELSETCIGCFYGTAIISHSTQNNSTAFVYPENYNTSLINNITVNYTLQGRNLIQNRDGVNSTGLVGSWRFDSSSCQDWSGNGNNGTAYNTICGNINGKINNGTSFNGVNSYVDAGNGASLQNSSFNAITISVWVKPSSIPTWADLVTKSSGSSNFLYFMLHNGKPVHWTSLISSTTTLQTNVWTHLVYLATGKTGVPGAIEQIYVNGVLDTQNGASGWAGLQDIRNLRIGSLIGADEFFNGLIDEVRVYNRALSAAEIGALYNATK